MEWFSDPLAQSAIIPVIVTLVVAMALRSRPVFMPLAVPAGFYISAFLISGLQLLPLTSTRKTLIAGLIMIGIALVRHVMDRRRREMMIVSWLVAIILLLWMLWPVLMRKPGGEAWLLGAGMGLYMLWLLASIENLSQQPQKVAVVLMMLGVAGGVSATLAASAMLGQLLSAMAAACGGFLLLSLVLRNSQAGQLLTTPVVVLAGMLSVAAVVYARLPINSLLLMAAIPALARIPLRSAGSAWVQVAMMMLYILPAVGLAIYSAWQNAGEMMY